MVAGTFALYVLLHHHSFDVAGIHDRLPVVRVHDIGNVPGHAVEVHLICYACHEVDDEHIPRTRYTATPIESRVHLESSLFDALQLPSPAVCPIPGGTAALVKPNLTNSEHSRCSPLSSTPEHAQLHT